MFATLAVVIVTVVIVLLFVSPSRHNSQSARCSVTIVVLGDIGRSPRMQYHALSIAKHGGSVQLVGYLESQPLPELQAHERVFFVPVPAPPAFLQTNNKTIFLVTAPLKVLVQAWLLWKTLAYSVKPTEWLLMQNPPSIPTLMLGVLVSACRGQNLVIDWHNYGWSILALKLGTSHPLVSISRIYEYVFSLFASAHFTVTDAMLKKLRTQLPAGARIMTLHDRPPELFQPMTRVQKIAFLQSYKTLSEHYNDLVSGTARLLVSSTSWTADEDFSIFLQALKEYSVIVRSEQPQLPQLVVVITGKGPLKNHYLAQIQQLRKDGHLEMVDIYTDWLSFEDYAKLLGSADLGISLHTSSSGVDLPMKVVDMFGAGLPVLGWDNFLAWPELVTEGVNGRGFSSAEQMTSTLCELFIPSNPQLAKLKAGAIRESSRRWEHEWSPIAGKFFGLPTT